jgi:hypothetical protein
VKHLAQPVVARKADVLQRLVEACDRATIHLLVDAVTAVEPYDRGLVAVRRRECCRPSERLRPVRGEALAVIGVKAVAERVAHQLISHHPGVPSVGQAKQALMTTGGLVDRLHAPRIVFEEPSLTVLGQ